MEQGRIWAHYQAGGASTAMMFEGASARHDHLARRVPAGSRVLNIGVGDGGLERKLIERSCETYSLDPNESSIAHVQSTLGSGDRARCGYSQSIPFDAGMFDVVVMSEVIEHLEDTVLQDSLVEIARVLRDDGVFLGTTPADENLADSECLCPGCGTIFHRYGHVQSFDEARLREALTTAEFRNVEISRHYFPNLSRENWRGRVFRWLKQLQLRLGATGSNETFVFAISRTPTSRASTSV